MNLLTFVVAAVFSLGVAWLASWDIWPFRNLLVVWVLGVVLVAGLHGLAGQLAASLWVEWRHPDWTRLTTWHHTLEGSAAVLVLEILLVLDLFGVEAAHLDHGHWWRYWAVAGAGAVALAVVTHWSLQRRYVKSSTLRPPTEQEEQAGNQDCETPIPVLSALVGITVAALFFVYSLGATSYYRQHHLHATALTVPAITGISGHYLAIGDSYSAGEGLSPFRPGTDSVGDGTNNGCHRSAGQAYSLLLALASPQLIFNPDQDFLACSGAVASDVETPWYKNGVREKMPAQVDGHTHTDVHLVTLTMGGNDIDFSSIVAVCFEYYQCLNHNAHALGFETADPQHPNDKLVTDPKLTLGQWLRQDAPDVGDRLDALFNQLKTDYPNARIVAIGYPYLFPPPSTRAPLFNDCASILRRYTPGTRAKVRALMDEFTDMQYERAVAHGVDFVSPQTVWTGHEPCGTSVQFTNSIKPFKTANITKGVDSGSFHPTADGQKQLAALVACYLNTYRGATAPSVWLTGRHSTSGTVETAPFGTPPAALGLQPAPGSAGAVNTFAGCGTTAALPR